MEAVVTPTMVTDLNSHRQKPSGLGFSGTSQAIALTPINHITTTVYEWSMLALTELRPAEVSEGNPAMNVANQGLQSGLLWYAC